MMEILLRLIVFVLIMAGMAAETSPLGLMNETYSLAGYESIRGGNRAVLKDLMGTGARQARGSPRTSRLGDTVEDCVEAIRRTKLTADVSLDYKLSFPPEDFVPPGAQEWCECIVADPPTTKIRQGSNESRADWDRAFDRCRTLVLDGSDFNTVDICRGMFDFFTADMRYYYHSFCGRLCSRNNPPYDANFLFFQYFGWPALDLGATCGDECAREAMPGYCNKYALSYGGWVGRESYPYGGSVYRSIEVNGVTTNEQTTYKTGKRRGAMKTCKELQPLLGCYNACCNYPRAFEALQICCSTDENGRAVFDCDNNFGGRNLGYDCLDGLQSFFSDFGECSQIGMAYPSSPDYGTGKLYKRKSSSKVVVMLPETFWSSGNSDGGGFYLRDNSIIANSMDPADLEYIGPTKLPPSGPTEPADCGAVEEDPCMGACKDGRQCVVAGNGGAFCVECSAFIKERNRGGDVECCSYNKEEMRCKSALKNSSVGMCKRNQRIVLIDDDSNRIQVSFQRSTGYACANPRDFRRNGKACKVRVNAKGVTSCVE